MGEAVGRAILDGRGLFSVLQEVLKIRCDKGTRVRLTPIVHSVLQDFRWLATDMAPNMRLIDVCPGRVQLMTLIKLRLVSPYIRARCLLQQLLVTRECRQISSNILDSRLHILAGAHSPCNHVIG
jgi:hypothetical protein